MNWKNGIITIQFQFEEDNQITTFMEWLAREFEPITVIKINSVEAIEIIPVVLNNSTDSN